MHETILFLSMMAFIAGLIDSAVGGGGLIQIPALFNALPSQLPATLFGTNKFSSVFGTATAARSFMRQVSLPWTLILPATVCAFLLSFAGAAAVSYAPQSLMRPVILLSLIVIAVYTVKKKDFGILHKPQIIGARERWLAALIGSAIGFYDGLFGPGTGSFLIFMFVRCFAFDFLHASAAAKFVNLATNLAALCFFIPSGHILLQYALPMALFNIVGSLVGTHLVMKGGASFVRVLFLVLLAVLITKFGYDLLKDLI